MKIKTALIMTCLAASYSALAAITFEEDFESQTLGTSPTPTNTWILEETLVVSNGAPLETQWMTTFSTNGWTFPELDLPDAAVMTVSFDGYFDTAAFGDGYMRMMMKGNYGNLNRLDFGKGWDMKKGSEFAMDKIQHFDIVMNLSGSTVSYNGTTIDHDKFSVWVEGAPALANVTMDQGGSDTNTVITQIGFWMNAGSGSSEVYVDNIEVRDEAYVIQYPWDTMFDYDYNGWGDAVEMADANGWDHLNQWGMAFTHTNQSGSGARLVHRPDSAETEFVITANGQLRKGWNWRGEIFTNGTGRAVAEGETLEFVMDYTMFSHNAIGTRNGLDFFFTTNNVSVDGATGAHLPSQQYFAKYPEGQLGFRTKQLSWLVGGAWPDGGFGLNLDPADAGNTQVSLALHTIGVTNLDGTAAADIESIPMHITYSAYKTTNSGIWRVTAEIANQSGGVLKTFTDTSVTNQALYDASNIYFGVYAYHNAVGEEGAEIGSMRARILHPSAPVMSQWETYAVAHGIDAALPNNDDDLDGQSNWFEYLFGGDPTNDTVQAASPTLDTDTGVYSFDLRGDDTLSYTIKTTADLTTGFSGGTQVPVTETNGIMNTITDTVSTAGNELFIKVDVE